MKSLGYISLGNAESVNKELEAATSIHKRRKYALNIPSHIRAEVGKYTLCYGTQAAKTCFSLTYTQYEFKQCTVNNWKKKITKDRESREGLFSKAGRPNKVNDALLARYNVD